MNLSFEPRQVGQPVMRRWLQATLELVLRSPLRFGFCIAVLAGTDGYAVDLARGYVVPKFWVSMTIGLLLAMLSVMIVSVARSADLSESPATTLMQLCRWPIVRALAVLGTGAALANWLFALTFVGHKSWSTFIATPWLQAHGQLLNLCGEALYGACLLLGLFFFPLLTLATDGGLWRAWTLSRRAVDLNLSYPARMGLNLVMLLLVPALLCCFSLFGVPMAAYLVWVNVFAYVAYRDVFEGRSENAPVRRGLRVFRQSANPA